MRISDWSSDVCSSDLQRYFLIPLQVAGDSQMGEPARGWNSARLIAETLSSFAKSARADYRLVFKIHPMERGHSRSEEHTSELQSLMRTSYAVFCLQKKTKPHQTNNPKYTKSTHCTHKHELNKHSRH